MKLLVSEYDLRYLGTVIDNRHPVLSLRVARMLASVELAEKIKADPEAMARLRDKLWYTENEWAYEGGSDEVAETMIQHLRELYLSDPGIDYGAMYDELYMEL